MLLTLEARMFMMLDLYNIPDYLCCVFALQMLMVSGELMW